MAEEVAFRNGSLQGGYFILAARALGLDCGPMSGFDNAAVDNEFFAGTAIRSNFLCNLGFGDRSGSYKRAPRLDFEEVCEIL
jgi:3-hydroxypropanoate dehydrogenase